MKSFILKIVDILYSFVIYNLYIVPKSIIKLFFNKELYNHKSYFPEKKQKKVFRIFLEQCEQIVRYGSPNEFYFMYGFDIKSKSEQNKYLHYYPFMKKRDELNLSSSHNSTCILRNKLYFGIFADAFSINTANNIAYSINGMLYLLKEKKYISVKEFINRGETKVFCKLIDGECGNGVFILTINQNRVLKNNIETTLDDITNIFTSNRYLIQEFIKQNSKMAMLHERSINSIRLITVRELNTNNIIVLPSILRIGTGDNVVDNTSQGGIAVGFDLNTGQLHKYGFYKPEYGLKVSQHPDSKVIFEDFYIPYIKEAIEQAKRFHSLLNDIHSIGWDIAIGENGPVFIEGNDNWEINGPQIGNHGLKEEFNKYFNNKKTNHRYN